MSTHASQAPAHPNSFPHTDLSLGDPKRPPMGTDHLGIDVPTLGLDGVEEREFILVKALKGTVPQGRYRQRLQV